MDLEDMTPEVMEARSTPGEQFVTAKVTVR
jgi:hypothetical protein